MLEQLFQERLERLGIEFGGHGANEFAGLQADGTKTSDGLAGRCMDEHRVYRAVGSGIRPDSTVQRPLFWPDGAVFLNAKTLAGSDCATCGLGLRKRKPS